MKPALGSLDPIHGSGPVPDAVRAWQTTSVRAANIEAIGSLLRNTVFAILLIRASSDPVFSLLGGESGAASMGVGAIFNALAIAIAGLLFLQQPVKAPFAVIAIWGPFLLIAFLVIGAIAGFRSVYRLGSRPTSGSKGDPKAN